MTRLCELELGIHRGATGTITESQAFGGNLGNGCFRDRGGSDWRFVSGRFPGGNGFGRSRSGLRLQRCGGGGLFSLIVLTRRRHEATDAQLTHLATGENGLRFADRRIRHRTRWHRRRRVGRRCGHRLGKLNNHGRLPVERRSNGTERGSARVRWARVVSAMVRPLRGGSGINLGRCVGVLGNRTYRPPAKSLVVGARHLRAGLSDVAERLRLIASDWLVGRGLLHTAPTRNHGLNRALRRALWRRRPSCFRFPAQTGNASERSIAGRVLHRGRRRVDGLVAFGLPNLPPTHGRLILPGCHVRLRYR